MKEYIDKAIIKTEIERLIEINKAFKKTWKWKFKWFYRTIIGRLETLEGLKEFLDSLEVKEEVLDRNDKTKLMRKCVKTSYKRGYDMGVLQTTNKINHNIKVDLELNSFDATVCKIGNTYLKEMDRNAIVKALEPYKDGDKVKVIIKAQKGE